MPVFGLFVVGRGERIRTSGPCLPKKAARPVKRIKPPLLYPKMAEFARGNRQFCVSDTGVSPDGRNAA